MFDNSRKGIIDSTYLALSEINLVTESPGIKIAGKLIRCKKKNNQKVRTKIITSATFKINSNFFNSFELRVCELLIIN